ncbi:hypothetical protein L7F22_038196 [Adiantum nelumboides]|nr:hypothetical protein [Adiantum nelumboides]
MESESTLPLDRSIQDTLCEVNNIISYNQMRNLCTWQVPSREKLIVDKGYSSNNSSKVYMLLVRESISRIKMSDGSWTSMKLQLSHECVQHYATLFAAHASLSSLESCARFQFLEVVSPIMDSNEAHALEQPFTQDELYHALKALGKWKAPGWDGLTAEFFHAFWNVLKDLAENFGDWRPVTLISVVYKLVTKLLVLRVRAILHRSLHPGQYGFISRRHIIDNIANASIAIEYAKYVTSIESTAFYVASPAEDKLPKDPLIGTLLLGKITYGKTQLHSGKDEKNGQLCPASYPLTCLVPPTAKSEEKQKEKDAGKKTLVQSYDEQVRDAKIKALSNLTRGNAEERKEWNNLASALKLEFPKDLKLLHEILIKLSATQKKEDGKDDVDEVIDAADQLLDVIDKEALAKFYGMNSVAEEPEAMKVDQEMEKQHDALVDALYKKGLALAELDDDSIVELVTEEELKGGDSAQEKAESPSSTEIPVEGGTQGSPAACDDRFEETYLELRKWVDISSTKYSLLKVIHEKRAGRFGTALKVLNELLQEDGKAPKRSLYELQVSLLEKVGWVHWAALAKKTLLVCFPLNYPLF